MNSSDPTQTTTTTGDTAQTHTTYDVKSGRVIGITTPGLQGLRQGYHVPGSMTSRAGGQDGATCLAAVELAATRVRIGFINR